MGSWSWLDPRVGRHGAVSAPAWTGVRRRQAAGAGGTTARTGGAASAAFPRLHCSGPAAKRTAAAPPRRTDHAGGRRLARCALLGGDVGTGHSDPPGLGNAGRPRNRSDHPSSRVRSRAERRGLHPHQGPDVSARRQRVSVSAVRHDLVCRRRPLDHRRQHDRMGERWRLVDRPGRQQRRVAAGRRLAHPAPEHDPLLRRGRHRRHGDEQHAHRRQPHRVVWLGRRRTRLGGRRRQVPQRPQSALPPQCGAPHAARQRDLARRRQCQLPPHAERVRRRRVGQRCRTHGDDHRNEPD